MRIPGIDFYQLFDRRVMVCAVYGVSREMLGRAQEAFLAAVLPTTRFVVVDLSQAERVSSSGVGLLVFYAKSLGTQGIAVSAVRPPARLTRPVAATALERVLPFYDSLDAALEATGLPRSIPESERA